MNYLIVQLTGNDAIFARFHLKRGVLAIDGATRETIDQEHTLASLLMDAAAAAAGRENERVVLVLPINHLFMRELELPISDRRKIRELLPLELKGETAFDSEELVFDSLQLEGGKTLAIWGKRKEIAEMISLMTANGMEPENVTAAPFSWHFLLPDEVRSGHVAITDGDSLAVYRDGHPCWFRALQGGELSLEVTRTLAALEVGKGIKVEKVLLHGAAAKLLSEFPEGPPVFSLLPGNSEMDTVFSDNTPVVRDLAGAYAVVRAVALEDPINFRSGDLAYTAGRNKALKRLRVSMILAAVLLLLLIAETSLRFFLVNRDLDSVNNSIRAIYRQVFPNRKKPVDEVSELRSEIKRLGGGGGSVSILRTLRKLAEIKGNDVAGLYEVEMDGNQLRVRGDASSATAVNDFRTRAAAVFDGTEVGEIKSRSNGSVTFLLRGTIREGGR
jgi:general secretion pathway protein L